MTRTAAWLAAGLLVAAAACNRYPGGYVPPEQRQPLDPDEFHESKPVLEMNDADAEAYLVADVRGLEGGSWRWTGARPTVRLVVEQTGNLKLVARLSLAGVVMEETGPVTISFYINDRLLDRVRYDKEGEHFFEKPVDPSWIQPDEDILVRFEPDKYKVSPRDGVVLGFILHRVGFVPR